MADTCEGRHLRRLQPRIQNGKKETLPQYLRKQNEKRKNLRKRKLAQR
ncbi:hypothetical protein JTE90_028227, partial [Oedothorax gibbosus]